jgi:hypothetical protein
MDPLFIWIESSALSVFVREWPSLWGFPFILILHTWGLAFLVGANVAIGARALGAAPGVPLATLEPYYRVMWIGFWINAVSGVLLLIAYPTKALTNPLFYVKLLLIAVALVVAQQIRQQLRHLMPGSVKGLAVASLACWTGAIFAGRFLAYTCSRLMVEYTC